MREKAACATLNRTPGAYGGAAPASDHLPIARRSARANDHAAKTLLFEVPFNKTNSEDSKFAGMELHGIFYEAMIELPEGANPQCGPKPKDANVWTSLGAISECAGNQLRYYPPGQKLTYKEIIRFRKTEKGWMSDDGKVY